MLCRTFTASIAFVGMLFVLNACENQEPVSPTTDRPVFAGTPADGNGNRLVFPVDEPFTLDCGAEDLTGTATGWISVRVFPQPKNRNVELDNFHVVLTYQNSAGETYTFVEAGPAHVWFDFDTQQFFVALIGRSAGSGLLGRLVVNLDTGEVVFFAGNPVGPSDDTACETLT
jgi:hypothetical protein